MVLNQITNLLAVDCHKYWNFVLHLTHKYYLFVVKWCLPNVRPFDFLNSKIGSKSLNQLPAFVRVGYIKSVIHHLISDAPALHDDTTYCFNPQIRVFFNQEQNDCFIKAYVNHPVKSFCENDRFQLCLIQPHFYIQSSINCTLYCLIFTQSNQTPLLKVDS